MEEPQQEEKEDPLDLLTPKELQAYIDQLKRESAITRIKVSVCRTFSLYIKLYTCMLCHIAYMVFFFK